MPRTCPQAGPWPSQAVAEIAQQSVSRQVRPTALAATGDVHVSPPTRAGDTGSGHRPSWATSAGKSRARRRAVGPRGPRRRGAHLACLASCVGRRCGAHGWRRPPRRRAGSAGPRRMTTEVARSSRTLGVSSKTLVAVLSGTGAAARRARSAEHVHRRRDTIGGGAQAAGTRRKARQHFVEHRGPASVLSMQARQCGGLAAARDRLWPPQQQRGRRCAPGQAPTRTTATSTTSKKRT